jgi:hypothetical protein
MKDFQIEFTDKEITPKAGDEIIRQKWNKKTP